MTSIFFLIIPIVLIILFLVHFVVYKGLVAMLTISSSTFTLSLKILLLVLGLGFVASMIISSFYNNIFTRLFYTVTASWYGFVLYFLLAVAIYTIVATTLNSVFPATALAWFGKILVVSAFATGIYGLWNAENIVVTNYDVSLPNLPTSWQGKRALWVSDVHLDQVHNAKYSERIVEVINAQNPDIVFIGGDLFDGNKVDENAVIAPFKNLKPPLGTFFITGNHEEFGDETHFTNAIEAVGIKVLDNKLVNIEGLNIIGLNDRDSTNPEVFELLLSKMDIKSAPTILLKHQPLQLDIAEKFGIAMQVSGHTHKSQIYPLSYVTKLIYKGYDYGHKPYGAMQVYTSSGVGTWGPPLRVGSKSEIVVFNFQSN